MLADIARDPRMLLRIKWQADSFVCVQMMTTFRTTRAVSKLSTERERTERKGRGQLGAAEGSKLICTGGRQ